jgi:hypothetical protein
MPALHLPPTPLGDLSSGRLRRREPCPRAGESGSDGRRPPPLQRALSSGRRASIRWREAASTIESLPSGCRRRPSSGCLRHQKPRPRETACRSGCGRPGFAPPRSEEGGGSGWSGGIRGDGRWRIRGRSARPAPWEGEEEEEECCAGVGGR